MTSIEWTDETWNPVTGCDRCSPGCDNCYALTLARRLKAMGSAHYQLDGNPDTSGPGFGVACHEDALGIPLKWKRPRMVFVNSMSDLFHPAVPVEFIAKVFAVMAATPQHTYQVLTKRPQRMREVLNQLGFWGALLRECSLAAWPGWDDTALPLPNVWLGTSIESDRYTFRGEHLRRTPAAVRFISAEPLLGPLTSLDLTGIDWLIAGGESGPAARPMHIAWVRDLRDRCLDRREECEQPDVPLPHSVAVYERGRTVGGRACACEYVDPVKFFFKQWGAWGPSFAQQRVPLSDCHHVTIDGRLFQPGARLGPNHMCQPWAIHRWGKKASGRLLDGRTWDEFPKARVSA